MNKWLKFGLKTVGFFLLIPLAYLLVSLVLTYIPISEKTDGTAKTQTVYLHSNGLHADIVLPKELITPKLLTGLYMQSYDRYFAFGWGEESFFLGTHALTDLKFSTLFRAAFLDSNTLIHLTRYKASKVDWIAVPITKTQLLKLNSYILRSFALDQGKKRRLNVSRYTLDRDDFYSAEGNYMFYRTCNSWVNTALKESDMKASLWTPFDFGALHRHAN